MRVELHMIPVKAGDATLIIDRSADGCHTVLIDAGLAKDEIVVYLHSHGITRLDLVILSHPDLDHLQGFLEVIKNPDIEIGQVWCFDLAFLRDFVTTGRLPRPQEGTHAILYDRACFSLLVDDSILKTASIRGIDCLQVSEGFRSNVGCLQIEVVYPWDGFYRSLRSARSLKILLSKRWPEDWLPNEAEAGGGKARRITSSNEQGGKLADLLRQFERAPRDSVLETPLATPGQPESEEENQCEPDESENFPISLLGTLYNNLSIVARIHVTGAVAPISMLFPGDLTDWTYLVARRPFDLAAEVFKYPHHGSAGPGISRKLLREFPFPPWRYCGPWCRPRRWKDCMEIWERIYHASWNSPELFREIVRPFHTLVFPYPDRGLPDSRVLRHGFLGQIHANRVAQHPAALNVKTNSPKARILDLSGHPRDISPV